jgi:hypothetical protein
MRARYFRGVIVVAIVASAMGCVRSGRSEGASTAFREIATARVTNNGWLDVNVYATRSGARQRLGTVSGQKSEVFDLPRHLIDARGLRIFIDLIGSPQTYQTELIPVMAGQQIDVVVQQRLALSHYSVGDP